jgi:hypothetical protein
MLHLSPHWYPVIGITIFLLSFLILLALSRDPYFNPNWGWVTLLSIAGGVQFTLTVWIAVSVYNLLFIHGMIAIAGALLSFICITFIWVWLNIQTLV